ncbi:MAG: CRISPR-associated protein Cmr3 [Chloroflexaceae bacterium]|nr:CRISPR-associated protein Cmr3 [Chloroflexaceae bacterium]
MHNQCVWIIEPRDPVIVRDGRPFDNTPGARARTLPFPYPSTLAGMVRTRAGTVGGSFTATPTDVLQIAVRGPLLVQLDPVEDRVTKYFAPAPADALLLEVEKQDGDGVRVVQLKPFEPPKGLLTAMPDQPDQLLPVGPDEVDPAKPSKRAPRFWDWQQFERWLQEPVPRQPIKPRELGIGGLPQNSRMHVAMQKDKRTGEEGKLFQTIGLEFTHPASEQHPLDAARRLALLVAVGGHNLAAKIDAGFDTLGGERRTVVWRKGDTDTLPSLPAKLVQQVQTHTACRIILLTPAIFKQGYRPTWLCTTQHGVKPTLRAVCGTGYGVISGWDYDQRKPKPTRRMLPAGSVLYLHLDGEPAAIEAWVQAVWLQAISDAEQDRRDGFGLAAIGIWNEKDTAVPADWGIPK